MSCWAVFPKQTKNVWLWFLHTKNASWENIPELPLNWHFAVIEDTKSAHEKFIFVKYVKGSVFEIFYFLYTQNGGGKHNKGSNSNLGMDALIHESSLTIS